MFWRVSHLLKDCCKTACHGILAEASHVFCAFHVSWCSHVTYLHCLDLCKHMLWCSYHKIHLHLSQSPWHLSKRHMQHNALLLMSGTVIISIMELLRTVAKNQNSQYYMNISGSSKSKQQILHACTHTYTHI